MDLVLGIDSSTTATKAIAWDRGGRAVAEGRAAVPMRDLAAAGWSRASTTGGTRSAPPCRPVPTGRSVARAALAISNQRETVGFLDAEDRGAAAGDPVARRPLPPDIELFGEKLPRERFLAITGKTPDPTPAVFSLHWLMRCEPEHWRRMAHAVDVLGYLGWRLTGARATSWGSADPHGVLDLPAMRYSPEILAALGMGEDRFFPAVRRARSSAR